MNAGSPVTRGSLRARRRGLPRFHDQLSRGGRRACGIGQAEARRVPRLLAERARQGLARTSTARAFSSVRVLFGFLDSAGSSITPASVAIQTPSCRGRSPRRSPNATWRTLLDAPSSRSRGWLDLRDTAILLLLYGAGLASVEALGHTKSMVEGLLKAAHDTLGVTGKGNKARLVPLCACGWRR